MVVCGLEGDTVQLHDPQRYPFVTLPVGDLVRAWNASQLGYTEARYTLRVDFKPGTPTSAEQRVARTLEQAHALLTDPPEGPVAHGGQRAFRLAAEVLQGSPSASFKHMFAAFILPLGARRSYDAAHFLRAAGRLRAAHLMHHKAWLYGQTQHAAATKQWDEVAQGLEALGELEAHLGIIGVEAA